MTLADLIPILQQATHNKAAGRSWVLLHPEQVIELVEIAASSLGKDRRLAQAAIAARRAQYALADGQVEKVSGRLAEIEQLAKAQP